MTDYQRQLIDALVTQIFEAETRHYHKQLDTLIDENAVLVGRPLDGFNYLGVEYARGGAVALNQRAACPALSAPLVPAMSKLLSFRKRVEVDTQVIRQILVKLIQPCQNSQDIRDALPECVVPLSWLKSLDRTREPAWSIQNNPRDLKLFQKCLLKIEMYCAMRYLY
jgi:hypothetical protein